MDKYHVSIRDVQSFDDCRPLQLEFTATCDNDNLRKLVVGLSRRYPAPQYRIEVFWEQIENLPVDVSAWL